MSPKFLFRLDLEASDNASKPVSRVRTVAAAGRTAAVPPTGAVQPLPDYALASR